MTYTNTQQKAQGACNSKGLQSNTNSVSFPIDEAINQAYGGNAISSQLARLALAGHIVHLGEIGDFSVCKCGMTSYCKDFAKLQAFARQLGVSHG